jgi:hypothetical protein
LVHGADILAGVCKIGVRNTAIDRGAEDIQRELLKRARAADHARGSAQRASDGIDVYEVRDGRGHTIPEPARDAMQFRGVPTCQHQVRVRVGEKVFGHQRSEHPRATKNDQWSVAHDLNPEPVCDV